jgi:hypothetical protein
MGEVLEDHVRERIDAARPALAPSPDLIHLVRDYLSRDLSDLCPRSIGQFPPTFVVEGEVAGPHVAVGRWELLRFVCCAFSAIEHFFLTPAQTIPQMWTGFAPFIPRP